MENFNEEYFITNKGMVIKKLQNNNCVVFDINGNSIEKDIKDIENIINSKIIFRFDGNEDIFKSLEYYNYNLDNLIYKLRNNEKYSLLLENKIKESQFIELLSYQYITKEVLEDNETIFSKSLSFLETERMDGNITHDKYIELIEELRKIDNFKEVNAYFFTKNFNELFDFIRHKIFHAEYRLKEISILQMKLLDKFKNKLKISGEIDIINVSVESDLIGYSIEDTIKSIVSGLDGISKLLTHFFNIKKSDKHFSKPANVLHNNIEKINCFTKTNPHINNFKKKYKDLKIITLLRNDITHNQAFHSLRQRVFLGYGTDSVNKHKLCYLDVLMWDNKKEGFIKKAFNTIDFYHEQNCAVEFLHNNFELFYELFDIAINVLKYEIKSLILNNENLKDKELSTEYLYNLSICYGDSKNYFDLNKINSSDKRFKKTFIKQDE